jgi:tetratricopeptide (TPR) repeat protein
MRTKIGILLIGIFIFGFGITTQAQTASTLLEKGIYTEETVGDLPKAMEIYQKIISNAQADRPSVAQAYFRLGNCYLKNGETKNATETFKKVINDFPDQKDLAEQARKKLPKAARPSRPIVIKTNPIALANDVSPDLDKITVTFDRPMMDQSWSWTGGGDTLPQKTGSFSYDSARTTCTFPTKLAPGKVYWLGVNSRDYKFFQTTARVPAQQYVILFATKTADGKPTPIPQDMLDEAKTINEYTEAQKHRITGEETKPVSEADKRESELLAAKGWRLWQQQKLPEAQETFTKATEKDPANANAWNGLGWSQWTQGLSLNANFSFEKCIALDPKHPAALNGLGQIAKSEGKIEKAIGYWESSTAPQATGPMMGLAETYMELKKYDLAVKYYNKWLNAEPNNPEAKSGLKKAKQLEGSGGPSSSTSKPQSSLVDVCESEMKRVMERKAENNPWKDKIDLASTYDLMLSQSLFSKEQKETEFKNIERYLAAHKGQKEYEWRVYHLLAVMSRDLGRPSDAIRFFDLALQTYPKANYSDPAKHSKFQHIVNEKAGLIWDTKGVEAGETFALEQLKTNPKMDFFFTHWWEGKYREKNLQDRYPKLLKQVKEAYVIRMKTFPEKAAMCKQYLAQSDLNGR